MHVVVLPSWYPSRHRPLNGIFFKEQTEILAQKTDRIGVVSPIYRSLKNIDGSGNKSTDEVQNNVITYTKEIWHFPKLERFNTKRWISTCLDLFENYIQKYGKPDLIHVHSVILGGYAAYIIHQKYNIPFVITEHASGFSLGLYESQYPKFRDIVKKSSSNIAVSASLAQILKKIIQGEWMVIPNTIKDEFFQAGKKSLQKNPSQSTIRFFSLSNLIPLKGLDLLIPAFRKLQDENAIQNLKLVIGGDGPERSHLEQLVKENQLQDQVDFLGSIPREEVLKQYALADIYVSASHQETFGVVIIEALAFGLPVVATRCGSPEFIVNDEVGIVVEKKNMDELYRGMDFILKNKDTFDRKKIIDYCESTYSEKVVGEQIYEVYRKATHG